MYSPDQERDAQTMGSEDRAPVALSLADQARVLDLESALSVAAAAMGKGGSLSKVDNGLAALYFASSGSSVELSAFIDANPPLPNALSKDGASVVVDVTVTAGGSAGDLLAQLQALGLAHGSSYAGVVSGLLPISAIDQLSSLDLVATAHESGFVTATGSVTTQADQAQRADVARSTYGFTGTGVRVGVISDSFDTKVAGTDHMAQNVTSDDLPAGIRILQDYPNGSDEGRAMGQLIHDLAPGSGIDFATAFYGQAGFANNIIALARAGDKVIVDDVGYFGELSYQQGPIAQAVNYVAETYGVTYFSSSGNNGTSGWQGNWVAGSTFTAGGKNYVSMNFDGQNYLTFTGSGANVRLTLYWDSPSAISGGVGATNDLDVFIYSDAALTTLVSSVVFNNVGGDAYEYSASIPGATIGNSTTPAVARYIRVAWNQSSGGSAPTNIRLLAQGNGATANLQTTPSNQNNGTMVGHNSAELGIGVAAAPYYAATTLESYSSGGRTPIVFADDGSRLSTVRYVSPLITGVDGGNTTFFASDDTTRPGGGDADTFPNFYGTSAAAPDVAAVAALLLSVNPNLTRAQVLSYIQGSAIDLDDPATAGFDTGFDSRSGSGLVQADTAVYLALHTFNGTDGAETLTGTATYDILYGNGGDDVINGGAGNDRIFGGAGADQLYGNQDNDSIYGGEGADKIYGGQGDDLLVGEQGDDFLEGGLGNDTLVGGGGFNTASYIGASSGVFASLLTNSSSGAAGVDKFIGIQNLLGSTFDDVLQGDGANNVIDGAAGNDSMSGGGGVDTVSYASATGPVTVTLQTTSAQNTVSSGTDSLAGFSILLGGQFNDTLTAANGTTVDGGGGDDHLYAPQPIPNTVDKANVVKPAATQNNSIANAVSLAGTFDLVANANITDSTLLPHTTINATVGSTAEFEYYAIPVSAGGRIVVDIDFFGLGGGGTDSFIQLVDASGTVLVTNDDGPGDPGDTGANGIYNSFIDFTAPTAGTYYAKIGAYSGASATPVVIPANYTYTLNISQQGAAVTYTSGQQPGGSGTLIGGEGNDLLESGAGDDTIIGGAGIDTVTYAGATQGVTVSLLVTTPQATGTAGTDTITGVENLTGSAFADTLTGDNGANVISGGAGVDTISGGIGADVLYGNQDNDVLYGNQDNDVLYGGQGDDVVYGGQGDDLISGGAGADQLQGNLGSDVFLYSLAADSTTTVSDLITGFEHGIDHVDLRPVIAAAAGVYSYNIANTSGDTTTLLVDLGNNGSYDMKIVLAGTGVLTASDIYFT